jgi:hypothetical protein
VRVTTLDGHYLPGISFTLPSGETLPASELSWAMVASCGCTAALHLITEDVVTEAMAWKMMSGNAAKQKRDKSRGFTMRMVKRREVDFGKCPHTPRYGYTKPPKPDGYSWATTSTVRTLHLVPLTELDKEQQKERGKEWDQDQVPSHLGKVQSVCERADHYVFEWTRKWYRIDGKVECTHCVKIAEKQVPA